MDRLIDSVDLKCFHRRHFFMIRRLKKNTKNLTDFQISILWFPNFYLIRLFYIKLKDVTTSSKIHIYCRTYLTWTHRRHSDEPSFIYFCFLHNKNPGWIIKPNNGGKNIFDWLIHSFNQFIPTKCIFLWCMNKNAMWYLWSWNEN